MSLSSCFFVSGQLARTVVVAVFAVSVVFSSMPVASAQPMADYGYYFDQGSVYYTKGDLTKSIDMFKKAVPLAPDTSLPMVYNNLAAAYIKRGNYFQDTAKQVDGALSDFRNAIFYMEYGWPEGIDRKPLHEKNLSAAAGNLTNAYRLLKMNPADKAMHLAEAKKLRQQGSLQEAIVEYGQAHKLDTKDTESLRALGDLFNVVNMPQKSKKFYKLAGDTMGDQLSDDILVQQANAQYKTGEVDQAVINYNKALEINPANITALNQLEKIWLNEIKFNNTSVLGHANLAGVYQKKKMYDQALQQYNAAEHFAEMNRATPFEVKKLIRLNMGTLFQERKQYQLANSAYDTVLSIDPNNVMALSYKATLSKEAGNVAEAQSLYNRLLSIDPNNTTAQRELFTLAKQQTDPAKLANDLKNYAERFPQNALVQSKVGEEFHHLKNYDDAAFYYQRAIRLDPMMAAAYANLGAVYQAQGKDQESIAAYQKSAQLDPKNKTVTDLLQAAENNVTLGNFQKAVELQQAGNHAEAIGYFKQSLVKDPNNADLIAAYGVSLQNTQQLDEAIRQYQKAISLNPGNANYQYYLGTAYHQKNQLPSAVLAYKKAAELDPTLKDAKDAIVLLEQQAAAGELQVAVNHYNAKRYTQALVSVNTALQKDVKNATAHYYKGLILSAQNNNMGAANSYRDALKYDPNFSDAYYALGVILDGQQDKRGAQQAFQKFVELSSNQEDDFVKYAQERLKELSTQ